jgi:hypothetical protein
MQRSVLFGLAICVACVPSLAQKTEAQLFDLPEHGQLQLLVPGSWHTEVRQPSSPLPPTVVLQPKSGAPFQILITVAWPLRPGAQLPGLATIYEEVASAAKSAASHSAERVISLQELRGSVGRGYWF